jgi:4-amino-4-deoxy-L-arabinose transferase-like glycosyltransferase
VKRSRADTLLWVGLGGVILAGAGLRLAFMLVSHPHVDEYSTIWAAQQILRRGIPLLPSGFIYLQGILFTYLDAIFIGLFGFSEAMARLPGLLCSVATLPLLYLWGRRAFGPGAGLIAATLGALEASSIIWGGRARMYALQELLVVLALYAFYRGYVEPQSGGDRAGARWRWTCAVSFIAAILAQTVTVLLAPALALSLIVWRGRLGRRWSVWLPVAGMALGLGLALALNRLGGPVSETAGRGFVDPALPWRLKPGAFFFEYFWVWPDILRTAAFIAGFVWLGRTLQRTGRGGEPDRALIYLLVCVAGALLPMIFLVSESWQRPRYVMMLLPVMDLLAAGVLGRLIARVARNPARASALGFAAWLGLSAAFAPAAIATIGPTEPAYDEAFRYVAARWQPGDAIIGPLPSVAAVYLGRCDGYALQNGFEEYLYTVGSDAVDRWTGAPLIDSAAALDGRFPASRRVWWVVDDIRRDQRYNADLEDYLATRMAEVYRAAQVSVYLRASDTH